MVKVHSDTICVSLGDYGVPLPLRIQEHCACCGENLLETDRLVFVVTRNGRVYVRREVTWGALMLENGAWEVKLDRTESESMPQGRYAYRIYLLREDVIKNTIFGPNIFEVI